MDVREFAAARGITERRVRALIRKGAIPAVKQGRAWSIEAGAPTAARSRRPLSAASRRDLLKALMRRSISELSGQSRARTAERIRMLRESDNPARLLSEWWGGVAPAVVDGGTSLVASAVVGDDERVRSVVRRRVNEYLRSPRDLADTVLSERTIRGLSATALAHRADVSVPAVRSLESATPTNLQAMRRVLRELDVEPIALPDIEVRR